MPKSTQEFHAKKPDYTVSVFSKSSDEKANNIGAGWINDNGSIRVKINPFIVLHGGTDLVITLFPTNGDPRRPFTAECGEDIPF